MFYDENGLTWQGIIVIAALATSLLNAARNKYNEKLLEPRLNLVKEMCASFDFAQLWKQDVGLLQDCLVASYEEANWMLGVLTYLAIVRHNNLPSENQSKLMKSPEFRLLVSSFWDRREPWREVFAKWFDMSA